MNSFSGATTYQTYDLAAWRATLGQEQGSIVGPPQFVASGAGAAAYRLAAGSPGFNAGRVGGVASGALTHVGAWEPSTTAIGCDF